MPTPEIALVRLTEVDIDAVTDLLNEPRNARHLPLAGERFTPETAAAWVEAKDGEWETNNYGPWAILLDGEFAGWGGFQAEENGADFALVLAPRFWGHGESVAMKALTTGFTDLGLTDVLIALPYSRHPDRAVARYGFTPDGDVCYSGVTFRQYRLTRADWSARSHPAT